MNATMARASCASRRSIQSSSNPGMVMVATVVWLVRPAQPKVLDQETRRSRSNKLFLLPATASAEGAQFNVAPFPASVTAEGGQFNGPPSLWEREIRALKGG